MKELRIIKTINACDIKEKKDLRNFIMSRFTKSSEKTVNLYKCILKLCKKYKADVINKQLIFAELRKIKECKNLTDKQIDDLIETLMKSSDDFISISILNENKTEADLNHSQWYFRKNLYEESNRINKNLNKNLKLTFSSSSDYISKYKRLTDLECAYYTKNYKYNKTSECIQNMFEASILQFIFEYLHFLSEMKIMKLNNKLIVESPLINKFTDEIKFEKLLTLFKDNKYLENIYFRLQYLRFKTIEDENNLEHYYELKNLFLKNLTNLNREDKFFFYTVLLNYAMIKEESTERNFKKEVLFLFDSMVENDGYALYKNQYMSLANYRNLIQTCYTKDEIDWFENFLSKHTHCLEPKVRESLIYYGKTHLYFLKREFEKSLEYSNKIEYTEFSMKLDYRMIRLKLYYELKYIEQAIAAFDAFNQFLRTSKEVPSDFRQPYLRFSKFYRRLLKTQDINSKEDVGLLRKDIEKEKEKGIVSTSWLLEKVNELNK